MQYLQALKTAALVMATFFASSAMAQQPTRAPCPAPTDCPAEARAPIGTISIFAEFPFKKKTLNVFGSDMAYVDTGSGRPVLFLHGNPTSSYLWRNIIPHVTDTHRAVAPDLIGMGDSGKPDIGYTYQDQARYLNDLIEQLQLKNIILVVHDWGSVLGMEYARQHPENVAGIVFMEALIPPVFPAKDLSSFGQLQKILTAFRTPGIGEKLILEQNLFVEKILLGIGVVRKLSDKEKVAYRAPFLAEASRKAELQWPRELPIGGTPAEVGEIIKANGAWLGNSEIPKLYFYANPGALNPEPIVNYITKTTRNLETRLVGSGTHYIQEDHPHIIGKGIADWLRRHAAQ